MKTERKNLPLYHLNMTKLKRIYDEQQRDKLKPESFTHWINSWLNDIIVKSEWLKQQFKDFSFISIHDNELLIKDHKEKSQSVVRIKLKNGMAYCLSPNCERTRAGCPHTAFANAIPQIALLKES